MKGAYAPKKTLARMGVSSPSAPDFYLPELLPAFIHRELRLTLRPSQRWRFGYSTISRGRRADATLSKGGLIPVDIRPHNLWGPSFMFYLARVYLDARDVTSPTVRGLDARMPKRDYHFETLPVIAAWLFPIRARRELPLGMSWVLAICQRMIVTLRNSYT